MQTNWFSPVINLDRVFDISIFVLPKNTVTVLKQLRDQLTRLEAQTMEESAKGKVRDPILETAINDIENLRDRLQQGTDKFFELGVYITIYENSLKELDETESKLRNMLEYQLVFPKVATFRMLEGFTSTMPINDDRLNVHTSLNTEPLSSIFPFVSFDLTSNDGILYGINTHNNSLVLFDRFQLENYNAVVFGKSGGGKSVQSSETVLTKSGTKIKLTEIGSLVDSLIDKQGAEKIDTELEGVVNPGIQVWSFNGKLIGSWSKVTVAARKKAPGVFYKFTTKSGREITTTGDHNMVVIKNGVVTDSKSSNIKKGEYVPIPRLLCPNPEPIREINLIELLSDFPKKHITDDQKIFVSRSRKNSLPCMLPISKSLLKITGYITSEGWVGKSTIMISNEDPEVINDIKTALANIQLTFSQTNRAITINSLLFTEIISRLGGGGKSAAKRVAPFIFNSPKELIAAYIQAYFEGDGTVSHNCIYAVSKSKKLVADFSYLLYYFGITARIKSTKKKSPDWSHKKTYWKLIISGQDNLRKFEKEINFVSKRKRELLAGLTDKHGNTNTDIVPELASTFQKIYDLAPSLFYDFQDISPLKRGAYAPSPEKLREFIAATRLRIKGFRNMEPKFEALKLPLLESIVEAGKKDKELNRRLWQVLGSSWAVMKNGAVSPKTENVLKVLRVVTDKDAYSLGEIKQALYTGFHTMGLPVKHFDSSLQDALVHRPNGNTSYEMIWHSSRYVLEKYQERIASLEKVGRLLAKLEIFANSDLFWDPIEKIEKIKNKKDKYVYDLTVDNEVFLAGNGGMFVHNSYTVKLEILRSLIFGTQVLIIDPEDEYKYLAETVGGTAVKISVTSDQHINPLDLPTPKSDESPADVFKSHILDLTGLLRLVLGELTPEESAILDEALIQTYAIKDITPDSDFSNKPPPVLSDLQSIMEGLTGAESMAIRLKKYTSGTFAGFLNMPTNVSLNNNLVVFSIRDMEEELRPIAMYSILNHIWTSVRREQKKRLLIVDEAWWLMKYEIGADFLSNIAKRARKYYLGLTTISQDINDMLSTDKGKSIVTNSSIQVLMKQSPAAIDIVQKTFNLTDAEKYYLLEARVGFGLFFVGQNHVGIRVVASYAEDQIITSDPKQILEIEKAKEEWAKLRS
ncbi:MAG: hypothetical protein COU09_00740 [Candidatus Harrisonbacteria bacterium CG10_big_fil_rev_8_21_14_0_10_44_23]|uniref:DOD-type homing endonuclease domain-containing protein n=1 Tax=Candidatus Harrisonbacteria bacterium CG10_big_fil_rev_8_21_14_0_10_44_23 TaxID=1974585 RepID=A0A2H0UQQ2_9BACT|nr:MAG: hypothetical protein COU09_00740 [Candidatus Harrisonbacteria bacterium CG10_big_fil_rev_8_21_14_0_10_44_23]